MGTCTERLVPSELVLSVAEVAEVSRSIGHLQLVRTHHLTND
ncbi:hypothetical protein GXM_04411 [Nostoc sphaeroides CCNUC1]|uniref:Uncharacterized protein n=1 Tax=Nostoc sphaeroides CCNUC1 TaxID=2653204 RepID=A0A5P8W2R0_9NOSO|nr:hypothetical protein GXM_04411 [Nostoc sphaeroides CCNUC1]